MTTLVLTLLVTATAAVWDWRTGRIPNWLTLPLLLLVPIGQWVLLGPDAAAGSMIGGLGCGLAPYILFRMGAIGGGDVKLFAVLGALNGFSLGINMFVAILVAGALQACLVLFIRGQLGSVMRHTWQMATNLFRPATQRKKLGPEVMTEMRLGPALLLGTVLAIIV